MSEGLLAAFVLAGIACAGSTAWLLRHPLLPGLLDLPGAHKRHVAPVPAIGGVGVLLGIGTAWLVAGANLPRVLPFALLGLLLVGLLDDRRGLGPRSRFVAQAAASLAMALGGGMLLHDFGELLWAGHVLATGWLAVPLTVFCAVGVINATNMIDGSDGLAGSLALLSLCGITVLALRAGVSAPMPLLVAAIAALAAFLAFNLRLRGRPARIFLGNGGSLVLGGLLAWSSISLSQGAGRCFAPVTALWLLAVPLVDTVSVMWRRLAAGGSPFAADHQHVHHLLLRAGHGVNATLAILLLAHATCIACGIAGEWLGVPQSLRFAAFLVVALVVHALQRRAATTLPPLAGQALR